LKILLINGPNLNLLGTREPEIYGHVTLAEIEARVQRKAADLGVTVAFRQSNDEGDLIDWIHEARRENFDGVIINPAAYTHTSAAIYDALRILDCPIIELHLANYHKREAFREHSFVATVATGLIVGLGATGYVAAVETMKHLVETKFEMKKP
jgi:3-dehydroquinate dehydratase-2